MMTMTELFYGPIEPTWFVHPQYRTINNINNSNKRPNGGQNYYRNENNPYLIYADDAFTYTRNPYMQRNAVPFTNMVAQDGTTLMRPGQQQQQQQQPQAPYPYPARYFVPGVHPHAAAGGNSEGQTLQKQGQNPVQQPVAVLQPRNGVNVQTVHFMVPLCCEKCEDKVKDQLLDLDDVQRVSCDQWKQKVTVTSSIAPEKLLARLQKIKKRSTFWPQQVAGAVKVFNGNHVNQQGNEQKQNQKQNHSHNNENLQVANDENSPVQMEN